MFSGSLKLGKISGVRPKSTLELNQFVSSGKTYDREEKEKLYNCDLLNGGKETNSIL